MEVTPKDSNPPPHPTHTGRKLRHKGCKNAVGREKSSRIVVQVRVLCGEGKEKGIVSTRAFVEEVEGEPSKAPT